MSWGAGSATHRAGVLRLLEGFRARGVPVDTLGIQSHSVTSGPDIGATVARQEGDWRAFLDAVVATESRLIITEPAVRVTGLAAPFAVPVPLVATSTRSSRSADTRCGKAAGKT